MPTEFYFKIQYFNFDYKLQSHFFTVTETLNSEKLDSSQCYSLSEGMSCTCIPKVGDPGPHLIHGFFGLGYSQYTQNF